MLTQDSHISFLFHLRLFTWFLHLCLSIAFLVAVQVNSDRMLVSNFALHMRAESQEAVSIDGHDDMKCFTYGRSSTVVHVRIATSLISAAQALINLRRELKPKKAFDTIALDAKMVWSKILRRVDVVDAGVLSDASNRHLDIFYTGLYRALTFPRRTDEVDASGKTVHYSPYDPAGHVHDGPGVTDNGFWDTFRTVYPLLSLAYPDHLGAIVQGWLNAYKEGGWLPSWASPGYRNCMVGTFADVVVADAIVKNVPNFDLALAKDALLKDVSERNLI
jgi:putative alpha-1,2-mannosidase